MAALEVRNWPLPGRGKQERHRRERERGTGCQFLVKEKMNLRMYQPKKARKYSTREGGSTLEKTGQENELATFP